MTNNDWIPNGWDPDEWKAVQDKATDDLERWRADRAAEREAGGQ